MRTSHGATEEPGISQPRSFLFAGVLSPNRVGLYILLTLQFVSSQVHKMLAEFRLIPGLNNLFDKLIWRKYTASNHVVHGQNENCDCSPVRKELNTLGT